ncbi:MAG: C25 family cysteine peptidase [Anaerolineae bacterium]|nr:C25 family cysteine peptidase [Thermoflexales bacterium]MDW8408171.1 C25 family cysteine peptidase [Anaerolineae bacterium]
MILRHSLAVVIGLLPLVLPAAPVAPTAAQTRQPDILITERQGGVEIIWGASAAREEAMLARWPLVDLTAPAGATPLRLPARLIALEVSDAGLLRLDVDTDSSLADSTQISDAGMDGSNAVSALPASPLFVLREGRLRGTRIAVLALTPLHQREGEAYVARRVRGFAHGARLWTPGRAPASMSAPYRSLTGQPYLPAVTPASTGPAIVVSVTQPGMQSISGASVVAAFASVGVSISQTPLISFHLRLRGQPVALEWRDADGQPLDPSAPLKPNDEARFFATLPGDRWNRADLYRLTIENAPGLHMARRSAVPDAASVTPLRDVAAQAGLWRDDRRYDSLRPGPDQDHWFSADMRTGPGLPPVTLTVPLSVALPPAAGWLSLTVRGSALTLGPHHLRAALAQAEASAQWAGHQDWSIQFQLPITSSPAAAAVQTAQGSPWLLTLSLWPASASSGLLIDRLVWEQPARLEFGGRGAAFRGVAGGWRYRLQQIPTGSSVALYDVTDPLAPQVVDALEVAPGEWVFEDGPLSRDYFLTGPGALHTPTLSAQPRLDLHSPGADVVYLAPAAWLRELTPVLALRQSQGYQPLALAVEDVYAVWSDGHVSPRPIRDFLRYAVARWPQPPVAAVLVGDGSADPFDYTARGANNVNVIPPYLAMVDPWLGETACEACYAQLDGDDPLSDWLPDIMLGRWPVKTVGELRQVVSKIVRFESGPDALAASPGIAFFADNAREADGAPDPAGDFAALADTLVASAPLSVGVARLYYDPYLPTAAGAPWRESDASRAHARTLDLFNSGPLIATYIGHASQWMWASTHWSATPPALLYIDEPLRLTNQRSPAVVLAMTCLSSAFHTPSVRGSTIDEQLFLAAGGAVAVWGPAGQGVLHGHDQLATGFFAALWGALPRPIRIGELTAAGYAQLFAAGGCCLSSLRTFVLLGDPLTSPRSLTTRRLALTLARR